MHDNPMFGSHSSGIGDRSFQNGGFKPTKVNGFLAKSEDRPVLVIQSDIVEEDINYLSNHALFYNFLGIQVFLPFLELWA